MSAGLWRILGVLALSTAIVLAIAWCAGCASVPLAQKAEAAYQAELLACTAQAKATDGGRAASKACERLVDQRWGVDGGAP